MNHFACVRADRLEDDVLGFLPILRLRRIILYDIEHFLAIETTGLVRVRRLTELALEIFPKIGRHYL